MIDTLEADKQSLIQLISWYRDKYHKQDCGHTNMINTVTKASSSKELEPILQTVDSWLDY